MRILMRSNAFLNKIRSNMGNLSISELLRCFLRLIFLGAQSIFLSSSSILSKEVFDLYRPS